MSTPGATDPAPVDPDPADRTVLEALRRDGRATLTEFRTATGLSEAVARRRPEQLRATEVLHLAVEYDHEPLGRGGEALCRLTGAPRTGGRGP